MYLGSYADFCINRRGTAISNTSTGSFPDTLHEPLHNIRLGESFSRLYLSGSMTYLQVPLQPQATFLRSQVNPRAIACYTATLTRVDGCICRLERQTCSSRIPSILSS